MNNKYYKHPQYGHIYGQSLSTPIGRAVWPFLTKPKDPPPPQDGKPQGAPRYELTLLLQKDNPRVMAFIEQLTKMTDEMLPIFNKGRNAPLGKGNLFGKNGDGDEADHEKYPFYKGCYVLVARNAQAVKVVDKDKKIIDVNDVHGGQEVRCVICPLITAHGISYKLEACQLWRDDGKRFGGAMRDSVELFDACEEGEEDEIEEKQDLPVETKPKTQSSKKGKAAAINLL